MKKTKPLDTSLAMTSLALGTFGIIGGIMNKMFGMNEEKTPQKLAEEMMAGAVRGILEHFEYKLDELKRQLEHKAEEKGKLENQIELLKTQIESVKEPPKSKKK